MMELVVVSLSYSSSVITYTNVGFCVDIKARNAVDYSVNIVLTQSYDGALDHCGGYLLKRFQVAQPNKILYAFQEFEPGGGEISRIRPDRPWGPPSLLYNGYRVCFQGVKWPERGVDHPPPSSIEVKETVELYLYSLFEPSRPVLR